MVFCRLQCVAVLSCNLLYAFYCQFWTTYINMIDITQSNTPQHTATYWNILKHRRQKGATKIQYTAIHCNAGAKWVQQSCNTLQHTATHCDTLQHTATQTPDGCNKEITHCNTGAKRAQQSDNTLQHTATHCMQRTATHCNILQHTATHRNTGARRAQQRHAGHARYIQEWARQLSRAFLLLVEILKSQLATECTAWNYIRADFWEILLGLTGPLWSVIRCVSMYVLYTDR